MHDDHTGSDRGHSERGGIASVNAAPEALRSVTLQQRHRVDLFKCSKISRVQNFFSSEARDWIPKNYCRVFILEENDDQDRISGYYTLSAALIQKQELTNRDDRKAPRGIPVPMVRIGFMGRDDNSVPGTGAALIVDAARRIHRNPDIAAWGIVLESEGGKAGNPKLFGWYLSLGFRECRDRSNESLYAPLDRLRSE